MDGFDKETGEIVERPLMPASVAAAIIAVKKQVKMLGVDDKNEHGRYNFVSVDKFYERIGKLMAEAGLALLINEVSSEVRGEARSDQKGETRVSPWLFVQYELMFLHESGDMASPLRRSCALPISGPQAYGAAQSYIEKQFLRQVFKVPTGEKDADDTPQTESAPNRPAEARQMQGSSRAYDTAKERAARPAAAPAPSEARAEAAKRINELKMEIAAAMTPADATSIGGCPAWNACAQAIIAAKVEEGATQLAATEAAGAVMDELLDRIARRVDMLNQPADNDEASR